MTSLNVGIIGCGNISGAYLSLAPNFEHYNITSCADLNFSAAKAQADEYGCEAKTVDELLADKSIDIVVNLTVPNAHREVSMAVLNAGKHVYSEKPFVLSVEDGQALLDLAKKNGLRVGSAPDTFLGGAHQAARQCLDAGTVGQIIGGSCMCMSHGMESWHPNPDFFFQPGGGPILDLGPYYISNLVQLLGPVKRVVAMSGRAFSERVIGSEERMGETVPVDVDTSVHSILEFEQGAQVSFGTSWDVWSHEHNHMELYGTLGSLYVPDPNRFGDNIRYTLEDEQTVLPPLEALGAPNEIDEPDEPIANYRGAGLADMAAAIKEDREHRCNGELALHVIDVLTSISRSAEERQFVELQTRCERPAALDNDAALSLKATV